ncbi:response regulator receiver domain protein [Paenibacillus sp. HGF5]|nr:response regulator receiver domain protein [Paenibacillus sp. HGF5]
MAFDQRVLVVDDEADIVRLLQTVLVKEGIDQVYTAATAEEAWIEFQQRQPDIVILDIMLPDGEGYEVCKKIRSVSNVPIFSCPPRRRRSIKSWVLPWAGTITLRSHSAQKKWLTGLKPDFADRICLSKRTSRIV